MKFQEQSQELFTNENAFANLKSQQNQSVKFQKFVYPSSNTFVNYSKQIIYPQNLASFGILIISILLLLILVFVSVLIIKCNFTNQNQNQLRSQFNKYIGYWYGDQVDFMNLPKILQNISDTNLTHQNLQRAAAFFQLLGKNINENQTLKKIAQMEIQYYDKKYDILKYQEEIQICVLVMSYNNQAKNRYKANLDSLFQQNYDNYFVIYLNDLSTDRTGQLVQKYIDQNPIAKEKMILINNTENMGKSKSRYVHGHHYCKPGSIMIPFDGDDHLIGRQVFKLLNALYQKRQAKFLYLNFLYFLKQKPSNYRLVSGFSKNVDKFKQDRNYRQAQIPLHLISYMTDLFLAVRQQDYKFKGQFVRVGEDNALLFTLQEMAGQKVQYVPQIVYNYNDDTGNNDDADPEKAKIRWQQLYQIQKHSKYDVYQGQIQFRLKKVKNQNKKEKQFE